MTPLTCCSAGNYNLYVYLRNTIMTAGDSNTYFVYILASRRQGALYVGVTNNLARRVQEHRDGVVPGFTRRYGIKQLVHYEMFGDIREAIAREKEIKRWRRDWKIALIEKDNPEWSDLFDLLEKGVAAPGSAEERST